MSYNNQRLYIMLLFRGICDVDIEIRDAASSTTPSCQKYARLAANAANSLTCQAKGGMSSKGVIRTAYLTLIPYLLTTRATLPSLLQLQSLQRLTNKWGGHNGIGSFKANDESLTTAVPLIPLQSPSFITPMKNGQILQVGGKLASKAL